VGETAGARQKPAKNTPKGDKTRQIAPSVIAKREFGKEKVKKR